MPVLHLKFQISSFEVTSYKKLHNTANSPFISCCFTSAFTSADMTFYIFLELHSSLLERFLSRVFLFYWVHPTLLNLLTSKIHQV